MNKSDNITKLAADLLKAQQSMGSATKDSKNPFFKSSYADLNSIREVAIPALNTNNISVLQPTVTVDGKNYVETVLVHYSGEFLSGLTEIKNVKGDAQGEGSGISYARRYGLQSLLNIGAVDDDGEASQGRKIEQTTKTEVKSIAIKRPVKELVSSAFKVLEAQKKITAEEFKKKYQKGVGLSTLTDSDLDNILKSVKADFPHLNL